MTVEFWHKPHGNNHIVKFAKVDDVIFTSLPYQPYLLRINDILVTINAYQIAFRYYVSVYFCHASGYTQLILPVSIFMDKEEAFIHAADVIKKLSSSVFSKTFLILSEWKRLYLTESKENLFLVSAVTHINSKTGLDISVSTFASYLSLLGLLRSDDEIVGVRLNDNDFSS